MDVSVAGNDISRTRELFDRMMKRVNTCIPGQIVSFDPDTQTCSVKPAIQARTHNGDVDQPTLLNVPLIFPYSVGGQLALTMPVIVGDPCILIFSQRCIDNWYQSGGIQPAESGAVGARHHDMNDGFAMLCAPPEPNVIGQWNNNCMEIRNASRTVRVSIFNDYCEVDGPTTFLSSVIFKDMVQFQSTFTDKNGVEHTVHKHLNVQTGIGISGVPTK